jgi:hypothetical protein
MKPAGVLVKSPERPTEQNGDSGRVDASLCPLRSARELCALVATAVTMSIRPLIPVWINDPLCFPLPCRVVFWTGSGQWIDAILRENAPKLKLKRGWFSSDRLAESAKSPCPRIRWDCSLPERTGCWPNGKSTNLSALFRFPAADRIKRPGAALPRLPRSERRRRSGRRSLALFPEPASQSSDGGFRLRSCGLSTDRQARRTARASFRASLGTVRLIRP